MGSKSQAAALALLTGVIATVSCAGYGPRTVSNLSDPLPTTCATTPPLDGDRIYDTTEVAERPRVRLSAQPRYPVKLAYEGIQDTVTAMFVVTASGRVDPASIVVLKASHPELARATVTFLQEAVYWPACRDGRPVAVRLTEMLDFSIKA